MTAKKGIFIDGHERDDVVESRRLLHFTNVPTEDAVKTLSNDINISPIVLIILLAIYLVNALFGLFVDIYTATSLLVLEASK